MHAEGIGWPPKKAGKPLNAKNKANSGKITPISDHVAFVHKNDEVSMEEMKDGTYC